MAYSVITFILKTKLHYKYIYVVFIVLFQCGVHFKVLAQRWESEFLVSGLMLAFILLKICWCFQAITS